MTFRARLTVASAAAVALAVLLASAVIFLIVRSELLGQVDGSLRAKTLTLRYRPGISPEGFPVVAPASGPGEPGGYVQVLNGNGTVVLAPGETTPLPVSGRALEVANGKRGAFFVDATVGGAHVRMLTSPIAQGVAVQVARSLSEVDGSLHRLALILLVVTLGGVGLAAGLGGLVARATLAPVRRLTEATEHVTATTDLTRRIDAGGTDELSRLARSFNTMLGALEASLQAQRQLVADASHELRTPLTSVRTNIEVLQRGIGMTDEERTRLLRDVVGQLEQLSVLVADLVELARGHEPQQGVEDVRLDELVADAVERQRKLSPEIPLGTRNEPALVRGVPARLDRAVRNLLDNAAKWSPPAGEVDVQTRARNGSAEVIVRDHGPGIRPEDLPFVFDRFYRAAGARGLPGSGLGLAIVKQVAESHGGTVTADNAPGGGAMFRLTLPAS
jgi:two-component system, OmpR family, sensor histidine kinase MprB